LLGNFIYNEAFKHGLYCPVTSEINFQPLIYASDIFIPLIDMKNQGLWRVNYSHEYSWVITGFTLFYTLFGWLLTTLTVAGLSGVIKKD